MIAQSRAKGGSGASDKHIQYLKGAGDTYIHFKEPSKRQAHIRKLGRQDWWNQLEEMRQMSVHPHRRGNGDGGRIMFLDQLA